jgi:hypothetical protein
MWNDKKSLVLSKVCVILFMAALLACAVFAPSAFWKWFKYMSEGRETYFLITVYLGCVPAALLLIFLYSLLHRLGEGDVFISRNVEGLRHISWCCFAGAAISFVSSSYWIPWFAVGVAAAFMGLIARVIKNVIAKAVSLQDDADFTI